MTDTFDSPFQKLHSELSNHQFPIQTLRSKRSFFYSNINSDIGTYFYCILHMTSSLLISHSFGLKLLKMVDLPISLSHQKLKLNYVLLLKSTKITDLFFDHSETFGCFLKPKSQSVLSSALSAKRCLSRGR